MEVLQTAAGRKKSVFFLFAKANNEYKYAKLSTQRPQFIIWGDESKIYLLLQIGT